MKCLAMASAADLGQWCRVTCAPYRNVDIKDMSTSFRDGLAFCAIIHKHRPDLIDFSSLSKDNVYQNNKLAFEVAQTRLGIPALLDPKEMVSTKMPDSLSVITYLLQYYHFFNRKSHAGPVNSRSSDVNVLNKLTSKPTDGLKALKSKANLEAPIGNLSNTRPRTVCKLCFKPVHLIQRHLFGGKICHRSCFRCKVCHSTLLSEAYIQGSDPSSLICSHHVTDSKSTHVDLHQQARTTESRSKYKLQASYLSPSGMNITSVPHYTKTESKNRQGCQTPEMEGEERLENFNDRKGRENCYSTVVLKKPVPAYPPQPSVADRTAPETDKTRPAPCSKKEAAAHLQQSTGGSALPTPAPRRTAASSLPSLPAPRIKASQTTNGSLAAGSSPNQSKNPPTSSHITSPTSVNSKVNINHPWMTIVHPGPWTQLPPAPAPVPAPRSKAVSNSQGTRYKTKVPPPNPFAEDMDEDVQKEAVKPESSDQTKSSVEASISICRSEPGNTAINDVKPTEGEAQSHFVPKSLSVPVIASVHSQSSSTKPSQSEACKENTFDRKPSMSKSTTSQDLLSRRTPAPGHGFPLIKRKVQTDQHVSTEDLETEIGEVDKLLEALEQRGIELERNLRDCKNTKHEEQMLIEWFSLIHERRVLLHRDKELVNLTTQRKLEEKQADVEYQLRCLLNKPESDWSPKDRGQEQKLMDELVAIVEQRNQIISSLDQDRQREKEKDELWEASTKNKEFHKEGLKEMKKSKGKFKLTKVFKMFNH
ncbi:MICAL-like protein 1 isoform X2 [Echeneis naucrates]|uniref:MICAL-like protein 1 isoform X2 n=1 Tax=Echeneis naucrates TaxID=173247 RepID=UPI001113D288|nr:MICAL-like protein 1 isoform X2 [Echeneis naucrates]